MSYNGNRGKRFYISENNRIHCLVMKAYGILEMLSLNIIYSNWSCLCLLGTARPF